MKYSIFVLVKVSVFIALFFGCKSEESENVKSEKRLNNAIEKYKEESYRYSGSENRGKYIEIDGVYFKKEDLGELSSSIAEEVRKDARKRRNLRGSLEDERASFYTKNDSLRAICEDGTLSYSRRDRGTCSHHGGVEAWAMEHAN